MGGGHGAPKDCQSTSPIRSSCAEALRSSGRTRSVRPRPTSRTRDRRMPWGSGSATISPRMSEARCAPQTARNASCRLTT